MKISHRQPKTRPGVHADRAESDPAVYRFGDLRIESAFPLGITSRRGKERDLTFRLQTDAGDPTPETAWFHHFRQPDGTVWLTLGRSGTDYVLRFPGLADFRIDPSARLVQCLAAPDCGRKTIRHLFLNQVMPFYLHLDGRLVLHAGAVKSEGGAVVFLGATGTGKSTLAASLCRRGLPLITDDCLVLVEREGRFFGLGSYQELRLWQDSAAELFAGRDDLPPVAGYTEKGRLEPAEEGLPVCAEAQPLHTLFLLDPVEAKSDDDDAILITPLSAREAFLTLVAQAFRLDFTDRLRNSEEFEALSRAAKLPIFRLRFPRDFSRLPAVGELILHILSRSE